MIKKLLLLILMTVCWQANARNFNAHQPAVSIKVSDLSPEAQRTFKLIALGGPFPYDRDGVVFGNYEKQLPKQPRGYYHEYTVKTPYARNRGAKRIICGGAPKALDDCYFTEDHYQSFRKLVP